MTFRIGTLTNNGTISGSGSIEPRLNQDKPASLTVKRIENGAVTLEADGDGKTDLEYSADGTTWQVSPTFTGVDLSAGCTFSARYKADGHFYQASAPASLTFCPVKLDANGGTIAPGHDVTSYTYGVGATLPTAEHVTRPGYVFAGWYDNAALTGSPVTAIGAGETGAKTYWAKWTARQYTVALHPNGGTIAPGHDVTSYTYGVGATLPTAEHVTRPGYVFAGWYDNAALTGSPVTAIGAGETGVKKLWASWIAVPVITSPAQDKTVTVYEGERATMAITAQHAAAYQWQMSTDGGASWTDCGTDSPAYTTAPAKLADNGTRYRCTVTGSGAAGAPLTAESPVFTLRVIPKAALPQTGDSSRPADWLTLLGACCAGLWLVKRRRG